MTMSTLPVYLIWALIVFPVVLVVAYVIGDRRGRKGERAEDDPGTAPDPNPLLASPDLFDPHGIVAAAEQYGDQYEIRQHSESHSFARWAGMHADRLDHIRKGQDDAGDHHEDASPTRRGGRNAGFVDRPSRRLTPEEQRTHAEDREHWDLPRTKFPVKAEAKILPGGIVAGWDDEPLTKGMVRETVESLSRGDRPSRRLTPGERDIHAADHEHWDMHRPVIASGLKILLDGQSKVDEGQLRDQRVGLSKDLEEMYSVLDELDEEDERAD